MVQEKQQTVHIVRSHIAQVTQKCKFPQRLRWSRRRRATTDSLLQYPNEIIKTPALIKSKHWQFPASQQLWLHSPIDGSVTCTFFVESSDLVYCFMSWGEISASMGSASMHLAFLVVVLIRTPSRLQKSESAWIVSKQRNSCCIPALPMVYWDKDLL